MAHDMRTISEIEELRGRFELLKAQLAHAVTDFELLLGRAEEAARRAELELRRRDFKTYTEKQAADVFQVSQDTISRLRQKRNLPHVRLGSVVRYTDEHLALIAAALERPARAKKGS